MASLAELEENRCKFCSNISRYTCPRCNAAYCSRDCYNKPSHANCSEDFYRQMIQSELQGQGVSEDCKRKMQDILKRVNDDEEQGEAEPLDSDDEEDETDLADRVEGIDLDDTDALWKNLTKSEQEEFAKILKSGDISELMPTWTPWWTLKYPGNNLVEEIEEDGTTSEGNCPKSSFPELLPIPPLPETAKRAPCIVNNIINVITAYVWMSRIFNGDYMDSCCEAVEAMFLLSPVLASNANYEEATVAVDSVYCSAQNVPWLSESSNYMTTVRGDVQAIVKRGTKNQLNLYLKLALSDIVALMRSAAKILSKSKKSKESSNFSALFVEANQNVELKHTTKPLIKSTVKKLEFYISYLQTENITKL